MAVDRERFTSAERARFVARLERCLQALDQLLARPGFGRGPATLGAELEVFLIDGRGRPLPANQKVLAETVDPRLTYELDRFNLECNLVPVPLRGTPFAALGREIETTLAEVRRAVGLHRGRIAVIGILPTLQPEDLGPVAMSDVPRYRALAATTRRRRRAPFRVRIDGAEPLDATCEDVTVEGANTSFQVHLRVDPEAFTDAYNAAQLATAPVLAAAGNSPTFLGHHLWEETRVALFKQAVDDRREVDGRPRGRSRVTFGHRWLRGGARELFARLVRGYAPLLPVTSGRDPLEELAADRIPGLDELRLHNGTVWRWNRPVYDPADGGHLRLEMRALPAGPTRVDMLANTAFLLGLTLDLAPEAKHWTRRFPFATAHHNFYRAAQHGLEAELGWPRVLGGRDGTIPARELVLATLPQARRGLVGAGVQGAEADAYLAVVRERVERGQTGAVWQRRVLDALERRADRPRALAAMLERYLELSQAELPVHRWPVGR